jgi:hypothetical protein
MALYNQSLPTQPGFDDEVHISAGIAPGFNLSATGGLARSLVFNGS